MNTDLPFNTKLLKLSDQESRVFMILLKGSQMSASEIAQKAKVNRTNIYDILRDFVERGFINEIQTNSIQQYEMIDPDIVADKIEADLKKDNLKQISDIKKTFGELKPHFRSEKTDSTTVNVELIRGYNQHRQAKIIELFKNAKKEMLLLLRLEGFISSEIDDTARKLITSGGVIRSVYETSENFKFRKDNGWVAGEPEDLVTIMENFESYGEQLKLSKQEVPNMIIFDQSIVAMNIVDKSLPKHNEADVIIKNPGFAKSMVHVFETYWEKSLTLNEFRNSIKSFRNKNGAGNEASYEKTVPALA